MKETMIQIITDIEPYLYFVHEINRDPDFSEPMLATEEEYEANLLRAPSKPNNQVLGVFEDGAIIGLFVFLIINDEKYIEMIVGLSREKKAYQEMAEYLESYYPSYKADFVFNPDNHLLTELLQQKEAVFEIPQQKMVLKSIPEVIDTDGIEPLSEKYLSQYIALHDNEYYWTGEKVAAAKDKFRVLLAVENETVVGYIDVTHCYEENEPYDIMVKEDHRRRGWGRKLLAEAIEMNKPRGMMLLVAEDNTPAIRLYESMGFDIAVGQSSITATWKIGVYLVPMTPKMYHSFFMEYENDPDLEPDGTKHIPYVYSKEKVEDYIQRQSDLRRKTFAIMYGEEIAGEIIIKDIRDKESAALGITMKNHNYKDCGLGTQVEKLAIQYVFHTLDIPVLFADSLRTNTRSQHVLEKVGYEMIGEDDDFKYYRIERG